MKSQGEILLPSEGETAAISMKPKTAALYYDKVWHPYSTKFPESIRCFGGTEIEMSVDFFLKHNTELYDYIYDILSKRYGLPISESHGFRERTILLHQSPTELETELNKYTKSYIQDKLERDKINVSLDFETIYHMVKYFLPFNSPLYHYYKRSYGADFLSRQIATKFSKKYGFPLVPIYSSSQERDTNYKKGGRKTIVSSISNLKIVDEEKLTWEQVLEFRKDKDNQIKYKRLLHWLDKEMVGKSQSFIEDNIAQKLECYEEVLKKKAIKTKYGTIELVMDLLYLANVFKCAMPFKSAIDFIQKILLLGGYAIGKTIVKLKQMKLNYEDIERGQNAEISWVYEVKKELRQ